jgi:hypothetical protein
MIFDKYPSLAIKVKPRVQALSFSSIWAVKTQTFNTKTECLLSYAHKSGLYDFDLVLKTMKKSFILWRNLKFLRVKAKPAFRFIC